MSPISLVPVFVLRFCLRAGVNVNAYKLYTWYIIGISMPK